MLLLFRIILVEILSLLVLAHCVDSKQNSVPITELNSNDDFFTNDKDDNSCIVYVDGNWSYSSLDQCLTNLTSNILINITTDVTLSSLVKISNLSNISIIGHNYPAVNCKSVGGIHFAFCHNCTIQGITWNRCGSPDEPGLNFINSSKIKFKIVIFSTY